jgi:hypothetical protein
MSRSYRKPYAAHCPFRVSAKEDKRLAARGMRRRQNQWLQNTSDFRDALVPHRLECHHNNVYDWKRDGRQQLRQPRACDFSDYYRIQQGLFNSPWEERREARHPTLWPPDEYVVYTRK